MIQRSGFQVPAGGDPKEKNRSWFWLTDFEGRTEKAYARALGPGFRSGTGWSWLIDREGRVRREGVQLSEFEITPWLKKKPAKQADEKPREKPAKKK